MQHTHKPVEQRRSTRFLTPATHCNKIATQCHTLQHTLQHTLKHSTTHCHTTHTLPRTLKCAATQRNTLQHPAIQTATHPATYTASHCNTYCNTRCTTHSCELGRDQPAFLLLQHTETHCNALQIIATPCNNLQ